MCRGKYRMQGFDDSCKAAVKSLDTLWRHRNYEEIHMERHNSQFYEVSVDEEHCQE